MGSALGIMGVCNGIWGQIGGKRGADVGFESEWGEVRSRGGFGGRLGEMGAEGMDLGSGLGKCGVGGDGMRLEVMEGQEWGLGSGLG